METDLARVVYVILNHDSRQAYAGLTQRFTERMQHHRRYKPNLFIGRYVILTSRPMSEQKAQNVEARAIDFLKTIGIQPLNVAKAGGLGGPILYWTKERCCEEASKYSSRTEFSLRSVGAYYAAQGKGWLDDICGHMINSDPMRYLKARGTRWHYVRRVPGKFSHIDPRGTIRVSLQTSSLHQAKLRRDAMERAHDLFWQKSRL